jgi:amidase
VSVAGKTYTVAESNAFVEEFELGPWSGGLLTGLQFAVSDLIDVEERLTGCGNPAWLEKQTPAACNALCLDILFSSGAQCIGRTKTDEFTFSLLGENSFFGTPLNPRAPERVPGGSSSGAASAVACGLVQFAIGLDSGAATQVSASNCGLYGWRPRQGSVPMAGILPVAPSFDTVGVLASSAAALGPVAELLSSVEAVSFAGDVEIFVLAEAWSKADKLVAGALKDALGKLEDAAARKTRELSLKRICTENDGSDLQSWYQTYLELYCMESWSCIGTWIEDRKPELGKEARANVHRSRMTDRSESTKYFKKRETYARAIQRFLGENKIICIPGCAQMAPKKGFLASVEDPGDYYPSTVALASVSAIGRLAQLTLPIAECQGVPIGISLLAANESILLGLLKQLPAN